MFFGSLSMLLFALWDRTAAGIVLAGDRREQQVQFSTLLRMLVLK